MTAREPRGRRRPDLLAERAEAALRHSLARLLRGETDVEVRRLRSVRAGKWDVYVFAARAGGAEHQFTVTHGQSERLKQVFASHYADDSTPKGHPAAHLDVESGFMVERFPSDWRLPALARVTRPQDIARLLADAGRREAGYFSEAGLAVSHRRYLPHKRCLVRYARPGTDAGYFGKLYSSTARARRAFWALESLQADANTRGLAPSPVIYHEPWRFILMNALPGRPLAKLLDEAEDASQRQALVEAAAALLARIHSVPVEGRQGADVEGVEQFAKREGRIREGKRHGAEEVRSTLRELATLGASLPPAPDAGVLCHGDFNIRQILIDDGVARAVDFDSSGPGDPARDVGRFMASLSARMLALPGDGSRPLSARFLDEYVAASGRDVRRRAAYYEVQALLFRAWRLLAESSSRTVDDPGAVLAEARLRLGQLEP